MDANDEEIHFIETNVRSQQNDPNTVLSGQADNANPWKLGRFQIYQGKVNWVIGLLLIIVIIEGVLYLDSRQSNTINQEQNFSKLKQGAAESAHLKRQNKKLKASLEQLEAEQEKLKKIMEASKRSYLNDALRQISAERRQSFGMIATPKGTVSELKQSIKDKDGKGIEDVLYKSDQMRKERVQFNQNRIALLRKNSRLESLGLCKYTIKTKPDSSKRIEQIREYLRINRIHNLSAFSSQLPMCIIVPSYNNNAKFRLEYNLNSIFSQNYTNYFAVIINDASDDGSDQLIRNYLLFYNISTSRYVYIDNTQRKTALENIYLAVWNHCSEDSIVVNLDGDDEFIGKNVLKIFNANYQKHRMGVVYSNYLRVYDDGRIQKGLTGQYSDQVKKKIAFRNSTQLFSHLRTHRADLFRRIPLKELQDASGHFFKITYDMAIYYPLMELACGRVLKISGFHYLYNFNTGLNDFALNHKDQLAVQSIVRNGKKIPCATDLLLQWDK